MSFAKSQNHFLASLSDADADLLFPHLKPTKLAQGGILYRAQETISKIYFPYSGVVSVVVGVRCGEFVEAGMFGRNGVIGVGALLDGSGALNQAIGQVAGDGVAGETSVIRAITAKSGTLRDSFATCEQMAFAQVQQAVACNALHDLEERLCRWLMHTRDLIQSDDLPLTQEFLAQMLGVQRSSVTLVARGLQTAGLIHYRRGRIQILDKEGLQDSCCECYATINAHYKRLTGWAPDPG